MVRVVKLLWIVLQLFEKLFTFSVILACVYTMYATVKTSKMVKVHQGTEHIRSLKRDLYYVTPFPPLNSSLFEEPGHGKHVDNFKEWYADRKVIKYVTKEEHPKLKKVLLNEQDLCKNKSVDILIYFHSKWDNFDKRVALRNTWANPNIFHDISMRVLFILGRPENPNDQKKINAESRRYRDIIQGDFVDNFGNITRKSIMAIQWINQHCIKAKYILKADDDMFVNIFAVAEFLVTQIYDKDKAIMCRLRHEGSSPIIRDRKNKWFVPKEIFPNRTHYPKHCSGYATLFTVNLIPELYRLSFKAPYFSVDDVYLFGYLLSQVSDVHYEDISNTLTLNQKTGLDGYKSNGPLSHAAIGAWKIETMKELWVLANNKKSHWANRHLTDQLKNLKHNDKLAK